jgi:GcrA cell cycle regulator
VKGQKIGGARQLARGRTPYLRRRLAEALPRAIEPQGIPRIPEPYTMTTFNAELAEISDHETIVLAERRPISGGLTVAQLKASSCRWPHGDPRDLGTFRYCGKTTDSGPFCIHHAQLAYLPRGFRSNSAA